jgi:sugar phosphate isomerase/epimerase
MRVTEPKQQNPTRRQVLCAAGLAAASLPFARGARADEPGASLLVPATHPAEGGVDPWHGLKVGIASYSFRKLPLEVTIKGINRVELKYVSVKDVHLSLKSTTEERKEVAQKFKDAGITPISCGNISMTNDEAKLRNSFEYARDLGVPTIVCIPDPAALPLLEKLVREFDIRLAIHNHGPEEKRFPSPNEVWEAVKDLDERIGLCIDVGHTARAGVDPAQAIVKYKSRLYDLHFKDLSSLKGKPGLVEVEVGRGVLDIRGMLKALLEIQYPHHVGFEHERTAEDPLPGIAESVGYTKATLAWVGAQ